jgi:hypothetical protein
VPKGATFEPAAQARGQQIPTKPRKVHAFNFKSRGHPMSKTTNLPSHRVYAVTNNGKQSVHASTRRSFVDIVAKWASQMRAVLSDAP